MLQSSRILSFAVAIALPALASLSGTTAFAKGDKSFVSAAITKTEDESVADDSRGKDAVTILNLGAAISVGSGVAVGLKYFDYSQDGKFLDDENLVISGYGPMVGYMHDSGLYINAAYLFSASKTYKSGGSKSTFKGTGYVIDAGKIWDVGSSFGVGIAVSQSKITYKSATIAGHEGDLHGEWSDSSFYPYLSLFLFF